MFKGNKVNTLIGLIMRKTFKLLLGHSRFPGPKNSQSCEAEFPRVDSKNFHATRVVTLSAEKLGTTSINNSRGITSGVKSKINGASLSYPSSSLEITNGLRKDMAVLK